jgi:hypothetical protein
MQLRDQLLVFLIGALGIRRGEMGVLRWMECNFSKGVFHIRHSYYLPTGLLSQSKTTLIQ